MFALHPHQSAFTLPADAVVAVPDGVPPARAVLAANMETALNAVWDAAPGPADRIAVVGGGVVGLSIARELKRRHAGAQIALIEKESDCGLHASGRNSGVLHAGFYYTADSLKARFTRDGNRLLAVPFDVTDPKDVSSAFREIARTWGGLDLVVINAGIAHTSSLAELDLEAFRRLERVDAQRLG